MTATDAGPALTGPIPDTFAISSFPKPARTNTRPTRHEVSWPRFCELFSRHLRVEHKDDAGWSPATYRPGTTRANANVQAVGMAVWDRDHRTPEDVDEVREQLTTLGLASLIYSTFQHGPQETRYRIVVPFTHPVIAGENWTATWARIWRNYGELLGGNDAQTCDFSRMYYQPAAKPGADVFAYVGAGLALNWAALPEAPNAPTDAPTIDADHSQGTVKYLGYATLEFIALGVQEDQRWHALAAARALLASGRSVEDAAALVWRGLQMCKQIDPDWPWTNQDAVDIVADLARRPATPLKPPNYPRLIVHSSGRLPSAERATGRSIADLTQEAQRCG